MCVWRPEHFLVLSFSSRFSCSLCTARTCAMFSGRFFFPLDVLGGFRSLESSSSGQQCLQVIRDQASVLRIIFFGPVVPSNCSSQGFGPSNHFLRASGAFELFAPGLRSLESSSSGQQCPQIIRVWASVPRIISSEPAAIPLYSSLAPESLFRANNTFRSNTRILVVTYQFGCRMSNTKVSPQFATPDGPVFVSNALCREIFHTY
jgi:hypothetical protein